MNVRSQLYAAVAAALGTAGISGAVAQSEEDLKDMRIEEVMVYGQRDMMRSAIDRQRDSDRIMSVITRDAIGNLPDQNVAESVRRLPGVNVLNDQGEGRFIAVRGLDPSLNASNVNGVRVPSPEADTRAVALDVIASELVESIEVVKTLTPDMDADTIGASIQINTMRAFEADDQFFSIKGEQSYNDLSDTYSPKGSVEFLYPINDRLGIAGGVSYQEREFSTDNIESEGWGVTDSGVVFADAVEYRDYDVLRERTSASLNVDFKASDSTTLYARLMYSLFEDTESRRRLVLEMDGEPRSGSATSASFLSEDGEIVAEREQKDRYEAQEIQTYAIGGETLFGDWELDYSVSYAYAEENEKDTFETLFAAGFEDPGALGIDFDYGNDEQPRYAISQGADAFFDPGTYGFDVVEIPDGLSKDEEITWQFNAARNFRMDSGTLQIKFGSKLRERTKERETSLQVFDDFDGDYTLADVTGQQSFGLAAIDPVPSLGAVRNFNIANLDRFILNDFDTRLESNIENFSVDEDILAGYLMARWESGPLTVIGGVRVERTDNTVRANLTEILEEGSVVDGVTLEEDQVNFTPSEEDNSYTEWLPSLSARYDLRNQIVLRAGFFNSLVRPGPEQLAPIFIIEESEGGDREGEFGNPGLKPYKAFNVDASVEWYFSEAGVLSGGLFYKEIDDFIVNARFEGDEPPFNGVYNGIPFDEGIIPLNGDEATVQGFEFNYQHALTQLPAPFNGLLLGLNYTYTDAEGDIGERTIPLPAAAEQTYNAMLGYESGPLSVRLTAAYRDEYLDELEGSPEEDRYVRDHLQVDLTASYDITDNINVYSQFLNLTDEPYVAFQRGPGADRLLQYEEYSWTARLGIQLRL
jgi:TonB-dependent receptor